LIVPEMVEGQGAGQRAGVPDLKAVGEEADFDERREPQNAAADNLNSLAICFAAMCSADEGRVVRPGEPN
jgi:hypothetical protein